MLKSLSLGGLIGGLVLFAVTGFAVLLIKSLGHAQEKLAPKLIEIEEGGPR